MTVTGNAALPCAPVRREQAQEEQQRLLDRDLVRLLVDEVEPLGRAVEDGAEVGADRRDEPLRLADRLRSRASRVARLLRGERVRRDASTPSGPSTSGSTYEAAE